jgi:molecular chaperone DnaK
VELVVLQGEREMARDNRVLGRFRLEGIRPAPRSIPQVKVTFDIDANGILSVTAMDQETGKEQRVTISELTNLPGNEVERMAADARHHADEDKRRREAVEARNRADTLAHQLKRTLKDLDARVPVHERAGYEQLIEEAALAVKDEHAGKERFRQLAGDLQQALTRTSARGRDGN